MNGPEPGQWYDVEDMVYESDETEFNNVECPYCGHILDIKKETHHLIIRCLGCEIVTVNDFKNERL